MSGKGRKENLLKAEDLASDVLRERARKGGLKKAENERKRRTFKDAVEHVLFDVPLNESEKAKLEGYGIKPEDFSKQMLAVKGLMEEAIKGNVQAFNTLMAIMGEKPADKIDVNGDLFNNIRVVEDIADDTGNIPRNEDDIPD